MSVFGASVLLCNSFLTYVVDLPWGPMAAEHKTKMYHIQNKNGAPLTVEKGSIMWL